MSSVRHRIVEFAASAIQTALGIELNRNLDRALETQRLPALAVLSGPDSEQEGLPGGRSEASVDIEVSYLVAQSDNPEATADALEVSGHAALFVDQRCGGLAVRLNRSGGSWSFDGGDRCVRTVVYRATYRTAINNLESVA